MSRRVCVVVDGYRIGAHLAPEFRRQGFDCVHVQSRPDLPIEFGGGCRASDFIDLVVHRGDVAETVRRLSRYDVVCALPGHEIGVEVADQLSEAMDLPSNGTRRSSARRNKQEMIEALREAGVPTVPSRASGELEEILDWVRELGDWPVVLKPPSSLGGEDVAFCTSMAEVEAAFRRIEGKTCFTGDVNTTVVAQAMLRGSQYIVNTISCAGEHGLCDLWLDERNFVAGGAQTCDRLELLDGVGPVQDELFHYMERVLDALEIRWGPAHAEVMMTAAGPILIEVGARLMGAIVPEALAECVGSDTVALTCQCYTRPEMYLGCVDKRYRRRRRALHVALVSHSAGIVQGTEGLDRVRGLPTYYAIVGDRKVGDWIDRTSNLITAPGCVYLIGDVAEDLERDYRQIREWERDALYSLAPG